MSLNPAKGRTRQSKFEHPDGLNFGSSFSSHESRASISLLDERVSSEWIQAANSGNGKSIVFELPQDEIDPTSSPEPDYPLTEKPEPEKPPLITNKEITNDLTNKSLTNA